MSAIARTVYGPVGSPVALAGWAFLGAYYVGPADSADCPVCGDGYVFSSGASMCRKCLRDWAYAQDAAAIDALEAREAEQRKGAEGLYEDALFEDAMRGTPTPDERWQHLEAAA